MQPEGSDLCNVVYTPEPNQRVLMPYHEAVPIGTSRPVTDHTVSGEASSDRLTWPRRRFIELTFPLAFDGGQTFTVAGAPVVRDTAVLGLGLDVALSETLTLGLGYDGQFSPCNRVYAGEVGLRWRF